MTDSPIQRFPVGCATIKEDMPLFEGVVNPSVLPVDELRLSKQCWIMLRKLLKGPATNVELRILSKSECPTARRTDIRNELKKHGWNLKKTKNMGGGVNVYALQRPDGSIVKL